MKFKINYYHEGSSQLLTKVIEATHDSDARALLQEVHGSGKAYKIFSVIPQPDIEPKSYTKSHEYTDSLRKQSEDEKKKKEALSYLSESKKLSGSKAALALASEAADKLAAYNDRQKSTASLRKPSEDEKQKEAFPYFNEQDHIWFYTVDNENIKGPFVLASTLRKIKEGTLQEDSLVMKAGNDWMTVSAFKKMDTASVAAPNASFTQKPTDNLRKPSEDEKQKEALPYFSESNISLDPTSGDKLKGSNTAAKAAFKNIDNSIEESTTLSSKYGSSYLVTMSVLLASPVALGLSMYVDSGSTGIVNLLMHLFLGLIGWPFTWITCWDRETCVGVSDLSYALSVSSTVAFALFFLYMAVDTSKKE